MIRLSLILASLFLTYHVKAQCDCPALPDDITGKTVVTVSTVAEIQSALQACSAAGGNYTILLEDGDYLLNDDLLYIHSGMTNLSIRSLSGNRDNVTIRGQGPAGAVQYIFNVAADDFTLADVTIADVMYHGVQIHGESDADNCLIQNVKFLDINQQFLKVSGNSSSNYSDNGVVQCCWFEFTSGIGYQYYTGGVDAHAARDWIIRNNTFKHLRSPDGNLAEHAVHFWSASENTIVENNLIIDCDRGVGFGLNSSTHVGGLIRNNFVHTSRDVGISLESSPGTKVYHNTVVSDNYIRSIEYRFAATTNVHIANNLTTKAISSRDGGTGTIENNYVTSTMDMFADPAQHDYHLSASAASAVVDAGIVLNDVSVDYDCASRVEGSGPDIGADERPAVVGRILTVGDAGDYPTLSATESVLQPGDTVLLLGQIFDDGSQSLSNIQGTESNPIVIMANPGDTPIFRGGTQAIHLINCRYMELNGITIEQQTANGINIDDGGDYSTPASHITVRNCVFRNMAASGNSDFLKLSGLDHFLIENCTFTNGSTGGGAGIDMVGCHWGIIQDCELDNTGTVGIQNKGGTRFITIRRNVFRNISQRALNLGGSTGLQFFRPPLPDPIEDAYEASDIDVFANIFINNWAPVAYVGSTNVVVRNNTFYSPDNWVIRILQENTTPGFLPCQNNEFSNNIIYQDSDLTEVNVGPNTLPETFTFSHNLWFNASSSSWTPQLPAGPIAQLIGDPQFSNAAAEDFSILEGSPAVGSGFAYPAPTEDFLGDNYASPPSRGAFASEFASLPVVWRYFRGTPTVDGNLLRWETRSEHENAGFFVQRKTAAKQWENLDWIAGQGDHSAVQVYTWLDKAPAEGVNYYRLQQLDYDGTYAYSSIIVLYSTAPQSVLIYPNPTDGQLSYELPSGRPFDKLELLDASGRVLRETQQLNGSFPLEGLPAGQYWLVFSNSAERIVQSVVKR